MIQFKLGMKMPGGVVYEVGHQMNTAELNLARDGHGFIYHLLSQMVEHFMEGLPREKDAK